MRPDIHPVTSPTISEIPYRSASSAKQRKRSIITSSTPARPAGVSGSGSSPKRISMKVCAQVVCAVSG